MSNSIEEFYNKGSNESTPTALDNLILNAAKQSCEGKLTTRKPKKWLYMLSTAAVLVMGISVVFNLQTQNTEITTFPESLDYSIQKEDSRTKAVAAPPLEPHLKPQKKRKRNNTSDKENKSGLLGKIIAQKPTIQLEQDSSTTQIENKTQAVLDKVLSAEPAVEAIELEEVSADELNKISEEVIVTGMRRAAKPVPKLKKESTLAPNPTELNQLDALITAENYKQAQELLEQLMKKYPKYDWQKYKDLI